ncbi:hypothetical protein GMSM_42060 [Geomonas sp. Red276]
MLGGGVRVSKQGEAAGTVFALVRGLARLRGIQGGRGTTCGFAPQINEKGAVLLTPRPLIT